MSGNLQIAAVFLCHYKPLMYIITLFIRIGFASPPIYVLHVSGKSKLEMQRIHMLVLPFALSTVLQTPFWLLIDFIICLDVQETDSIMSSCESIFPYSLSEVRRTKLKIFQKPPAMERAAQCSKWTVSKSQEQLKYISRLPGPTVKLFF